MAQVRLPRIVEFQDGLITRTQALDAGMTPRAVRYAIRKGGPWQRVLRGVYATFTGQLTDLHRLRAAHLHAGPESRVTGAWACWMSGLKYGPPRDEIIVVLVPYSSRRGPAGFVRLIRSVRPYHLNDYWVDHSVVQDPGIVAAMAYGSRDEVSVAPRLGVIPRAAPARAVVDTVSKPRWLPADWLPSCPSPQGCGLCRRGASHRTLALRNVRAVMCEVVQRQLCTVNELAAEVAARSPNGTAVLRQVLVDLEAGCRSAPECELHDVVRSSRVLPEARWNQVLPGSRGIYPDACWPDARLVVEVDSRAFHGFGNAPERTERRRARYAELGWTVLPVSPRRLRQEPDRVLAEIEAAYLAGLQRRP